MYATFSYSKTMNLLSITLSLLSLLHICTAQSADPAAYSCNPNSKTNSSNNQIKTLLDNLVSGTIQRGFISTVQGAGGKNQIYGLAQCRGDVSKNDCSTCINDAAKNILKLCPGQSDARIWYDFCFLRYGRSNFFGQVDTSGFFLINVQNVTDAAIFNKKLAALMNKVGSRAPKPASRGLGKGKSDVSPFDRLYGLVQCTRDLSELACAQCASIAIGNLPIVCGDKRGCRVLYGSCYVRYELYPFFFPLEAKESIQHHTVNYKSVLAFNP
ncbi:hypothetical protein ABFS82_04G216600 [Erythranthe guttata]|nr:PREDICTED: cysteine-rich repeat secretory protein 55-like [Erythranthe guttata]|eukprot:XP_012835214.1 PREDICTED: cysteine-rich repeat secretory protein 55-like [Erythranthe guttata]